MPKVKYTYEILKAIDPVDLTAGQRTAAIRCGLYPVGFFATVPCSNCKAAPRHHKKAYCKSCFDELYYNKYYNDQCPKCGTTKRSVSPHCRKCRNEFYSGENAPNWKGGYRLDKSGYVYRYVTNHPRCGNRNAVFEHILVMEEYLGRYLLPEETVHHKNGIKNDNRIENLELWSSRHPKGQRIEDLVSWCKDLINDYPEYF